MGDSEEYEYDESTVVVEISGIIEQDFLKKVTQAKVLGIGTDQPLLQLDDYTFQGGYQDTIGTNMLFRETEQIEATDQGDASVEMVQKVELDTVTNKRLSVQRVFLKNNNAGSSSVTVTSEEQPIDEGSDNADSLGGSQEPADDDSSGEPVD